MIFIAGASGFIGARLAAPCSSAGDTVICATRGGDGEVRRAPGGCPLCGSNPSGR